MRIKQSPEELKQISWVNRAEKFAHIRAHIRQILSSMDRPLDLAEIANEFKLRFRYLPSIERRLRELVASGDVRRNDGSIPTYEFVRTYDL